MSQVKTRGQKGLLLAEELVASMEQRSEQERRIYGGLCHSFPVLVRTSGLCQALAFSLDKSTSAGSRGQAHEALLKHAGRVLGIDGDERDVFATVRQASLNEYMMYTRILLQTWIYFKRFAVSILKVSGPQVDDEDELDGSEVS